jgi:hypothetical protein
MKLARPPKFFFLKCYLLFFFPLTLLRKQKQKSKNRSKKKHIEINKETGRDSERIIQGPRIRARNTCWLFVSCPCLVNATLSLSLSLHWLLVRLVLTKFCPLRCPSFSHFLPPIFYWKVIYLFTQNYRKHLSRKTVVVVVVV